MIYLDNNATTEVDKDVLAEMEPYYKQLYGNPGSLHTLGKLSKSAIDVARERVARFLNAEYENVFFTSSGTEANNLALYSQINKEDSEIIVSATEHDSIIRTASELQKRRLIRYRTVEVDNTGRVGVESIARAISAKTSLISVMMVNNEVGTRNPVKEIASLCNNTGIVFHTDCVQAVSSEKVDFKEIGCQMMSISSHKIHGPKGVGALISTVPLNPIIFGGSSQEFGVRGGTENVPAIVGFGKACQLMHDRLESATKKTTKLKQLFYKTLYNKLNAYGCENIIRVNGCPVDQPGKTLNLTLNTIDGETLLLLLSSRGVCVSAGAACSSLESKPSHVLLALGLSENDARNSIRFSFSRLNNSKEITDAATILADCICVLRTMKA